MAASFGPIIGHFKADAVSCETLLALLLAIVLKEEVVEWPKNGHTAENRSRELTCIMLYWV